MWDLGFMNERLRFWGLECKVQNLWFGVEDSGFRVQGLGFRVQVSGFKVQGPGFRVQGSGFGVEGGHLSHPRRDDAERRGGARLYRHLLEQRTEKLTT